jgi:malate synthase
VRIEKEIGADRFRNGHFDEAVKIFTSISKSPQLEDFLTLPAYERID